MFRSVPFSTYSLSSMHTIQPPWAWVHTPPLLLVCITMLYVWCAHHHMYLYAGSSAMLFVVCIAYCRYLCSRYGIYQHRCPMVLRQCFAVRSCTSILYIFIAFRRKSHNDEKIWNYDIMPSELLLPPCSLLLLPMFNRLECYALKVYQCIQTTSTSSSIVC